jgi:hypothetical protein
MEEDSLIQVLPSERGQEVVWLGGYRGGSYLP